MGGNNSRWCSGCCAHAAALRYDQRQSTTGGEPTSSWVAGDLVEEQA